MKMFKKIVCTILVVLMLLTSAPMQGFVGMDIDIDLPDWFGGKAKAVGVSGYNAVAAVEWAKAHVYDTWSCLYGQGYWEPGTGDCANFVSQCIYMGGVDQSDAWNHSGYKAHYSTGSNGSWIRASQLHDFVVSIGGVDIQNPSVSQIEVGDLIFYKQNPGTSGFSHCAIVIDVSGGVVTVAAHTTNEVCYTDTNWHLGFSNEGTHLVKMYGATCTEQVVRSFDVYTAGNNAVVYSDPSTGSTRRFEFFSGEYAHIYETKTVNGVVWGYTCGYGANFYYGWVKLNALNYKCHVSTGPVDHIMGDWYVKVQPTCIAVGVEERVCSRCGYTEQRNMSLGGNHKNIVEATCLSPSYCTACGATISDALGHDWENWSAVVEATCLTGGEEKRSCNRCGITENRTVNPLGHNHQPVVDIPTCVTDGTSTFECTRCGDSYIEESEWSAWTDEYNEQYFIDNLIPESMYESRTEYRYRDKKYTTEDSTSDSLSKSGWTWYKSEHTGYTDYADCEENWQDTVINSDELTYVHTRQAVASYNYKTVYNYYRYASVDADRGGTGQAWEDDTYKYYRTYKFDQELTDTDWFENHTRYKWWHGDTYTGVYASNPYTTQEVVSTNYKTQYCAHKRQKIYTNHFWQWSAWSDWSTTPYTETSERDVETRTVYRIKQAALGHIWDDGKIVSPTCHEDGYTEYTCNRCGVSIKENIIPALGDLWGEKHLISEEGVTPRVYRQDCIRGCGCNCGCYKTFIEECEYEVTGVIEATCTEQGFTTYTCVLHGETYDSDYVDALGHKEDGQWFVTKAPTCTESGESMCKCVRHDDGVTCDKTYTRSIDAVGHSLVKTAAVAVTCEQDGNSEYYQCKICNKYFADSQAKTEIEEASWIITATGHNGKNVSGEEIWITELEASCGLTGRECLYCQNEWCDYVYECENHTSHHYLIDEREIAEIIPDYAIVEHKDSTCIELGYDIWSCLNCYGTENEHGWTEIINYKFHDWSEPVVVYATCTDGGTETITCNYCKREETYGTEDAIGHALSPLDEGYENSDDKMELVSSVANVCGDGSVDTYQCTHIDKNTSARCTYTVTIGEAKEHSLGDYIITLEPTCTEEGYKHKECTNEDCGYRTADETIPSIGHDWNLDKTIEPTCETQGYEHYICNNDSSHEYDDYNKSMLGHEADNNWVVTKAPTCAEKGEEQCKCVRFDDGVTCSKIFIREIAIDPDAHDWGEWETVTPATCEEDGLEKRICKNDASHVEENILPAIDHDWDDGVIDPASTCKTHGTKTYTCQNDNSHKKAEEVALDENNHVGETYIKDDKAATCLEDGYTGDTYCSDCNALLEKGKVIPATDHDWGEWETVTPATCEEEGLEKRICKNDASHVEENILPAINHDWDDGVIDPASTCKTHGTKTYTCQNDNSHKKTEEVTLDENNHVGETYIKDDKAATCLEDGYTGDTYCSDCNALLEKGEVIPATDHDWGEWETVTPATCEEEGLEKRICKNDASHTETNPLAALSHEADNNWVVTKEPNCAKNGEKQCKCVRHDNGVTCDKIFTEEIAIDPDAHDWGEWKITTEPTYDSVGEKKQVCNNDASHINTESIPVLTRPSDENENIETDKTVDYDKLTGEAVIRLLASSKGETITTKSRIPLDIVLVLDQSGSMADGNLIGKLKNATTEFVSAIYADAVANSIDHRIAMVGFAMQNQYNFGSEYYQYLNTEILTTGGAPIRYNSLASDKMNEAYKNALVSVNSDGINPILTTAIANIEAKGATAADLGLDMACKIFSQNESDGSRKRIVVFMTDGVPTYKSDYMDETADNAKSKAELLKNTYEADLYSVGVLSGGGASKAKTFLNSIASADAVGNKMYYDCSDAEQLVKDFEKIATESTTTVTDFDDITLVDTVSSAFTLTYLQEQKLRVDAIEKLGVKNEDITVTRYPDGTTEFEIRHITPKKIENGSEVSFVVDFSFSVTANENALVADSYVTNTDNAGVILGTKDVYENNFAVPDDNVEEAEGVIYFNVNGITYHVVRVHAGDKITQPEIDLEGGYTFSGWDIPDEITFEGGKYTIDATLDPTEYTVTWIMDNKTETDVYHYGDIIDVPVVGLSSQGDIFTSWDKAVPTTMPAENLTFTAVYGEHKHVYEESVSKKASCGVAGEMLYTCLCGDNYTEKTDALTHKWATRTTSSELNETAFSNVYCENCGDSPDENLSYTIKGKDGRKTVEYDLKLVDAEDITINDKGEITVSLPIPEGMKNAKNIRIYREEEDGTLTDLGGVKEGVYITFTTDHFSKYIIKAIFECDETGKHTDSNCDKLCDICGVEYADLGHRYNSVVTKPTCTAKGYTTHTCSVCGDSYTDAETAALGHRVGAYVVTNQPTCTEKGSEKASCSQCDYYTTRDVAAKGHNYVNGKCTNCGESKVDNCSCNCHKGGFMGFIWKIVRFFWKLFKMNPVCDCGMKHY